MSGPKHSTPNTERGKSSSPSVASLDSLAGPHLNLISSMAMAGTSSGPVHWGAGSMEGMVPLMIPVAHLQALQSQIEAAARKSATSSADSSRMADESREHRHRHKHRHRHSREERHRSSHHRHHDDKRSHRKYYDDDSDRSSKKRHKRDRHGSPDSVEHRHRRHHSRRHGAVLLEDVESDGAGEVPESETYAEQSYSSAALGEDRSSDFEVTVELHDRPTKKRKHDRPVLMEDGEIYPSSRQRDRPDFREEWSIDKQRRNRSTIQGGRGINARERPLLIEDGRVDESAKSYDRPILRDFQHRESNKSAFRPAVKEDRKVEDSRSVTRPVLIEDGEIEERAVLMEDDKMEKGTVLMEDGEIADDAEEGELEDDGDENEKTTYQVKQGRSFMEEGRRDTLRHGRSVSGSVERDGNGARYRGKSGAILMEDREGPVLIEDRDVRPEFREDRRKGAVLIEDRFDRPVLREDGAILGEDRIDRQSLREDRIDRRPILREDRIDRPILREDRIDRPILREDRIDRPLLREDRTYVKEDRKDRPVLQDDRKDGPLLIEDGAILKGSCPKRPLLREDGRTVTEERNDRAVLKEDRSLSRDREEKPILMENGKVSNSGRTGALLLEDSEVVVEDETFDARFYATAESENARQKSNFQQRGRGRGFDRGRGRGRGGVWKDGPSAVRQGRTGALLLEDRDVDRGARKSPTPEGFVGRWKEGSLDRGMKPSQSSIDLGRWSVESDPNLPRSSSTQNFLRHSRERSVGEDTLARSRPLNRQEVRGGPERGYMKEEEPDRRKRPTWEPEPDDISVAQCIRSVPSTFDELDMDPIAAWVRCSAADLYFQKDPKTGNMVTTKRMRDLEDRFEQELVERASRIKAKQQPYHRSQPRPNWKDACSGHGKCCGSDRSSSSSSESSDSESDSEEWWMEELKFKQQHPYRLHPEIWYNEPNELNYGALCRCSMKSRKSGIRHNIYPGEQALPMCDVTSNNLDKLYHYRITVSPAKNFLINKPTVVMFDNHEYFFEGFSIFAHKPIPKLPDCRVIRFNIIYTIHIVEEQVPENFSIRSLDLVTRFLFDEILELVDLDWKGPGHDSSCRRFHVMPRFARPFPENGKELLSMNDVMMYLLKASKPLIDPSDLRRMYQLDSESWTKFVDTFRHMVVTCPGKRPSSIRVDQLDREGCVGEGGKFLLPLIVHHGMRPPQLSYAGDPLYKKKWREYMKFRHLMWSRAKVGQKERDKLADLELELEKIRMKCTMKREFTAAVSSEGFLKTGIRADICQHAMMLPVLFEHVRFHECLTELENAMKYTFTDRSLLQLALTHCSYKVNYGTNPDHGRNSLSNCGFRQLEFGDHKVLTQHTRKRGLNMLMRIMSKMGCKEEVKSEIPHNERLEYLGDAVVEFIASTHLYSMFPLASEGELTLYRGSLVQNAHLSILADKLHLQDYLLYAHGPDLCHDSHLRHAMANCFEALMGALFLEGGIEIADRVFSQTLFHEEDLYDTWVNTPKHPLVQAEPNGDRHWIQQSHILQDLIKFEEDIGYEFRHIRLLAKAFTQRNVGFNNLTFGHNQRLEFLGDTVIQLITSEFLYKHFPDHHEGHLTLLRSSLVNNKTQSIVASELGMPDHVIKSSSRSTQEEEKRQMRTKERADLLEAVLGSLYVDGGLAPCRALVETCFFPRLKEFILDQEWNDPKSQLQQCCLTLRDIKDENPDIPIYKVLQCLGPTNLRKYTVAVYFRGRRLAIGKGGSIQQAEMAAAAEALNKSQDLFPTRFYPPKNRKPGQDNAEQLDIKKDIKKEPV